MVAGAIDASRDVGFVHGTGGVSAAITAGRDLGRVYAGGYGFTWSGWYSTWGEFSDAPSGDFTGTIDVAGDVYGVFATGDVSGPMTAGGGIADVSAKGSVTGDITAGASIGYLGELIPDDGGYGEEWYYGDERYFGGGIFAGVDVNAAIEAGGDITAVRAGRDIAGTITAGRDIGPLNAPRTMSSDVYADRDIGSVTAGLDVSGDLNAGRDIGNVTSGIENGGSISGLIAAGGDIGHLTAYGLGGRLGSPWTLPLVEAPAHDPHKRLELSLWTVDADEDRYDRGSLPTERPFMPSLTTGGNITGTVTASGNIGVVVAFGRIDESFSAGGSIGITSNPTLSTITGVWSAETITGDITAGAGVLTVRSWDRIDGDVTTQDQLRVWAYNELSGDLKSRASDILAGSWDSLTGSAEAEGWVDVRAFNDIGKGQTQYVSTGAPTSSGEDALIKSVSDAIRVWSGRTIFTPAVAEKYVALFAILSTDIPRSVSSRTEDVFVETSEEDIVIRNSLGDPTQAKDLIWLKAGRDASGTYFRSTDGSVVIDAGRAVSVLAAQAKKNLWVSARGGKLDGSFLAEEGWAYAWAYTNFEGRLTAKQTASVSALNDVNAEVTSTDDGAEVYAGRDVTGEVKGRWWAEVRAGGSVDAPVTGTDGDARVTAGNNIKKKVTANGDAELIAGGAVSGGADATRGLLEVTANGSISGDYTARDDLVMRAGGDITAQATGESTVKVVATGAVHGRGTGIRSTGADVTVQSGGSMTTPVDAAGYAFVEAVGEISGAITIKAGKDVSVLAGGDISAGTTIEGEWVADVRSANGEVKATVKTRKTVADWFTDPTSPAKQRLDILNDDIAYWEAQLQTATTDAGISTVTAILNRLKAERETLTFPAQKLDYNHIPADRVKKLVADGLAFKIPDDHTYTYSTLVWNYTESGRGYVFLADVVGGGVGYRMILEPFRYYHTHVWNGSYYETVYDKDPNKGISLAGQANQAGVDFYKVVYRGTGEHPLATDTATYQQFHYNPDGASWRNAINAVLHKKAEGTSEVVDGFLEFGLRMLPLDQAG